MFLEIEGDLLITDVREERSYDPPQRDAGQHGQRDDPEGEDGRRREAQRFEGGAGADEHHGAGEQHAQQAAHEQPAPPSHADLADDTGHVSGGWLASIVEHRPSWSGPRGPAVR